MIHRTVVTLGSVLSLHLLSSCAGPWSEARKDALSTVSVTRPTIEEGARKEVKVIEASTVGAAMPMAAGGGLIPGLIGVAIDAGVNANRKGKFEQAHGSVELASQTIAGFMPGDVDRRLAEALTSQLRQDAFFGPRVRKDSPNRFDGYIHSYALVARDTMDGVPQIGAAMQASIWIMDAEGETPLEVTKTALSDHAVAATELMRDRKKVERLFDEACRNLVGQVQEEIDTKLSR